MAIAPCAGHRFHCARLILWATREGAFVSSTAAVTLSPSLRVQEHRDGALLLDLQEGKFFSVDPVGKLIVGWLRECSDHASLCDRLKQTFPDIDTERLESDLTEFLASLEELNMLAISAAHGRRTTESQR